MICKKLYSLHTVDVTSTPNAVAVVNACVSVRSTLVWRRGFQEGSQAATALDKDRAEKLRILEASISKSTAKGYAAAWKKWQSYAALNGLKEFPVTVANLSLYLAHIAHRGKSVCEATTAAISWHHDINGADSPT